MLQKIVGLIIVGGAMLIGSVYLLEGTEELASLHINSRSAKLHKLWKKDLAALKKQKKLPGGFDEIKELHYTPLSKMSAQWMSEISIPIKVNHEGKYRLNIQVDHWSEKSKTAAVVHYQMVDIKSGNTVWEFGRTYPLRK